MADEMVELLKEAPLFGEFSDSLLQRIAQAAQLRRFGAKETVFREGQTSREVYLVRSGRVALEICAPTYGCRRILSVEPGELLGWSPILDLDQPLTATARTLEPVELVALDARQLRATFDEHPELGYHFLRQLALSIARRLTATRMQLLDLYGDQMATVDNSRHQS